MPDQAIKLPELPHTQTQPDILGNKDVTMDTDLNEDVVEEIDERTSRLLNQIEELNEKDQFKTENIVNEENDGIELSMTQEFLSNLESKPVAGDSRHNNGNNQPKNDSGTFKDLHNYIDYFKIILMLNLIL